jgi:AcrR family transcriptional regulator
MELDDLFARPRDSELLSPEQRLSTAALDCIAEAGLEGATVRAIAAKAGLNPGAINYYFRSKDRMVEEALRGGWLHMSSDIDRIMSSAEEAGSRVDLAVNYLIDGAYRYPKLLRAIVIEHPALRLEAAAYLKSIFGRFEGQCEDEGARGLHSTLLLSFFVLLSYSPETVCLVAGVDTDNAGDRRRLAGDIAALLYGPSREA